jgi:hypothetical protein
MIIHERAVGFMPLGGTKIQRFSALMNGVFIGVGLIFLIWGATDIIFPITEIVDVAVFGLMRILLGAISLSIGIGVEAVEWTKMDGKAQSPETSVNADRA